MGENTYWPRAFAGSCALHLVLLLCVGMLGGTMPAQRAADNYLVVDLTAVDRIHGGGGGGGGGGIGDGVGGGGGGGGGNSGGVIEGFNDKFGGSIKLPQPPSEAGGDAGAKGAESLGDAGSMETAAAEGTEFVSGLAAAADGQSVPAAVKAVMAAGTDAPDRDKLPVPELDFDIGSGIGAGSGGGVGEGSGTGVGSGAGSGVGEGAGSGIGDGSGSGIGSGAGPGIDSGSGSGIGSGSGSGIGAGGGAGIGSGSGSGGIGAGSGPGVGSGSGGGIGSGSGSGIGAGSGPGVDGVILAFLDAVEENKEYPYMALRMGQEGAVTLLVELSAAGDLDGVQIVRSSGFAALDNAAVAIINRVTPFRHGLGQPVAMKIPINYRLLP